MGIDDSAESLDVPASPVMPELGWRQLLPDVIVCEHDDSAESRVENSGAGARRRAHPDASDATARRIDASAESRGRNRLRIAARAGRIHRKLVVMNTHDIVLLIDGIRVIHRRNHVPCRMAIRGERECIR